MIAGAVSISMADPGASELVNWKLAMDRECDRYGLDAKKVAAVVAGNDPLAEHPPVRHWWEAVVMIVAVGIFVWLGIGTISQHLSLNMPWMIALIIGTIVPLGLCGTLLWRRTRFS
jgi:hypothetical protein